MIMRRLSHYIPLGGLSESIPSDTTGEIRKIYVTLSRF